MRNINSTCMRKPRSFGETPKSGKQGSHRNRPGVGAQGFSASTSTTWRISGEQSKQDFSVSKQKRFAFIVISIRHNPLHNPCRALQIFGVFFSSSRVRSYCAFLSFSKKDSEKAAVEGSDQLALMTCVSHIVTLHQVPQY
ncbi:hypothetical protein PoB_001353100 [Plakobranchus ocellatus]|uniref:Uncharacterized protein n=1 Tax=Plakobranchus ocellatus TaxID=259542 RepID=A0AAV3YXA8_9GAST|nr:hypothetical protein PoB_001353100 [Plakobranchus ocellatus]